MKVSKNWINEYLNAETISDEHLGEILTDIGLEVEGVEQVEKVKGSLKGVKVGKVLTCQRHPNADRLSLTTVDVGGEAPLQVVCGAPNVDAGQTVLVATPGTVLYSDEGEPFTIKKGKIRGEVSEGMICAEDELGLGSSHDGIMVLEQDYAPGTHAADVFEMEQDTVYEIGLTPNRSDATGHIGVARDVNAYLRTNEGWTDALSMPQKMDTLKTAPKGSFEIEIRDTARCPRYSGLLLRNVKIAPSPDWMQFKLKAIGVRPINNVVDITNYILHEYGQPLHAFDADKVKGNKIIVETKPEGTPFTTLDEVERKLGTEDLMICDGQGTPMCIAGVFGGLDTGVTDQTVHIFLESAQFDAKAIRRTSYKHQLRTDAAMRFEKGSDPNITVEALQRAAFLMRELAGAEVDEVIIDQYPTPVPEKEVVLRYEMANRLIGTVLSADKIQEILLAMDMKIVSSDEVSVTVQVPTNKTDVLREVDLIEEILRIYGYNKVPLPDKLSYVLSFKDADKNLINRRKVGSILTSLGFSEMMGLSLMSSNKVKETLGLDDKDLILINNTSNTNLDAMRPNLIFSGLESVAHNLNHQQRDLKLYEWGRVYYRNEGGEVVEKMQLSILMTGDFRPEHWKVQGERKSDFYDTQSVVRALLRRLGIKTFQEEVIDGDEAWEYGMKFFRGPKALAEFGAVSQKLLGGHNIKQPVFGGLLHWENIAPAAAKAKILFERIPKTPAVRRDLAIVIDSHASYAGIERIIRKAAGKLLREVTVFDIYKSEKHLGKGKVSYAIKMVFQDPNKTLRDKDVDKVMGKIIREVEQQLGGHIRK